MRRKYEVQAPSSVCDVKSPLLLFLQLRAWTLPTILPAITYLSGGEMALFLACVRYGVRGGVIQDVWHISVEVNSGENLLSNISGLACVGLRPS